MKIKILLAVLICFVAGSVHAQKLSALPKINSAMVTNLIPVVAGNATYNLVTVGDIRGLQQHNFGTIAGGATATVNINTNLYRGVFSGSTFIVNLPTPPDTTNGYWAEIKGTNTSGGTQIVSFQVATVATALVREEIAINGVPQLVSTITNGVTGAFTLYFETVAGVWSRGGARGDVLTFPSQAIEFIIAASDEITAITAGAGKVTFRAPFAFTLTEVRASVNTAPTGATLLVDINETGTTVLSTKLMVDATEKTSTTASTPYVISDASIADDAEISIDIDQVGSVVAGAGVKVTLKGTR